MQGRSSIDAATLVFTESMVPDGEEAPGRNDAKVRIDIYLNARVPGGSHRDLRKLIRQAYTLANAVTALQQCRQTDGLRGGAGHGSHRPDTATDRLGTESSRESFVSRPLRALMPPRGASLRVVI